ncbi:MAG: protein translocase subunit SecF [Candidatus Moraniibacteriota bacterium]|nr:MAG: protein translocase subunit SecF [Candidatus Moranbacteria bacterium]
MLQIIDKRKYTYIFSAALVTLSVCALAMWGIKPNSDFTGGTTVEFSISGTVDMHRDVICEKLEGRCNDSFIVQGSEKDGQKRIIIKYKDSNEQFNQKVLAAVTAIDSEAKQLKVDFTGAVISEQLKKNATKAVIFAVIAIMLYIAWAFRKVSVPVSSWYYGAGAVTALAHDIVIALGIFAVLGQFWSVEVGVPFVAALLTILGYSVNDTIVVYDRIRENVLRTRAIKDFEILVNKSLNESLARSFNTSFTVVVVLVPIILFGGESLFNFSLALLVGVIFGTYSSIFVATALIVSTYNLKKNHNKN